MSDDRPRDEDQREPPLLTAIDGPADLQGARRRRSCSSSRRSCATYIIDMIGEIGGHFGANLGTCELAVALHSLLESPARQDPLGRRPPGLPAQGPDRPPRPAADDPPVRGPRARSARSPSPSTTSWAPATPRPRSATRVGLKEAMRQGIGEDGKVVAVIGDGALTGGVAYEALHAAGGLQTPIVIVLNDNGMSISPNVGALSRYFNRVRLNPRLYHAREEVEDRLTKLPLGLGKRIERLGPEIKSAIKAYWAPGPALRGARPRLRRRDRRPRRRRAARGADRGARRRAAGRRPHPHRQGQGLRAGRGGRPRGHGEVARRQAGLDRRRRAGAEARSRRWSRSRSQTRRTRSRPSGSRSRRRRRRRPSTRRSSPTRSSPRPSATRG